VSLRGSILALCCATAALSACSNDKAAVAPRDPINVDASMTDLCAGMCEAVLQIDCPDLPDMTGCVDHCNEQMLPCNDEVRAYFACITNNGPAVLECDTSRQTVMVRDDTVCQDGVDSLVTCLDDATMPMPVEPLAVRLLPHGSKQRVPQLEPQPGPPPDPWSSQP